jgi:hypothetical protein
MGRKSHVQMVLFFEIYLDRHPFGYEILDGEIEPKIKSPVYPTCRSLIPRFFKQGSMIGFVTIFIGRGQLHM